MGEYDRRESLRFLGAGNLLAMAAFALPLPLGAATQARAVPSGQFRLTRLLERELVDGASLVVERIWSCRFGAAGRGMRVDGAEAECHVSAPPPLAALAQMERSRGGPGPFPVLLDSSGRIADQRGGPTVEPHIVIEEALEVLARSGTVGTELSGSRAALTQLAAAAQKSLSAVPLDLFFPEPAASPLARELELAPGTEGKIELTTSTQVQDSGLLRSRERRVVTTIGDDSRVSREVWTLIAG